MISATSPSPELRQDAVVAVAAVGAKLAIGGGGDRVPQTAARGDAAPVLLRAACLVVDLRRVVAEQAHALLPARSIARQVSPS
jgi:hypothetical protein